MSERVIEVIRPASLPARARGLIAKSVLPERIALHLVPCWCVHTALMKVPIDVVFLDRRRTVVKVVECLPPWRICGHRSAHSVLEFNAGTLRSLPLRAGDTVQLLESDPHVAVRH